ncbi:hypothetical protein E4631_17320 [Hymenobacter sp. UV11]|uniref:hypothetical protein n=1 Tax=Hymenobacter sp. UV11 TaxID=1849735 RepID=UPI0010614676|nr:hypothetical protein [Hymenobacter sp. UV11]TDN38512.1 hypothetical protein A8B98_23080 [Hymenobacter sp. UV11]TFZ65289.1 hypothetical protein E4631_17320 [Hymenobacter sp. UV11]
MSRKLLALLVAAFFVLSLATYVYYRRTLAAVPIDAYALVPDDAVLVLATHDHPALVQHLQEAGVWDNLTGVRYYQQVAGQLALADSLDNGGRPVVTPAGGRPRGLLGLLGKKLVLTSLHLTGRGQFDLLYQVPLETVREYRQARGFLETLARDPRYTLSTRTYEGYELDELTARTGGRLTVLNYRNHLLFSTNAVLVEAVVHRLGHLDAPTVHAGFGATDLLRLPDVDATVLVNFRRVPALLDVLFQPGTHAQLDQVLALAHDGLVGLKFSPGQLALSGFANPETAANSWQQYLRGQPAQALRPLADVLPLHAALVLAVAGQLPPTPPPAADSAARRPASYGPALDSLRASLVPGAALVYLTTPAPGVVPAQVLVARCRSVAATGRWLARLRRLGGSSPAFSRVGSYEVQAAGFEAAPLLGPLAAGVSVAGGPALCTALVGNYLIISDAISLKRYLGEVAAGQVWSSSAAQVALLQQTLPQARLTVLADVRQGWNALLGYLAEDRRAGLLRNESMLRHFPQVAWQLLPPDLAAEEGKPGSQYFAQLLLRRPGQGPSIDSAAASGAGTRFRTALVGRPLLLPALANAVEGSATGPVVITDSLGVLHLLPTGPAAQPWADSLPGPVVGLGPRLARGRLLLATAHNIHWLNPADGQQAPGFPLNLPDSVTVAYVAAGTSPRLVVATAHQDLLLFDTNGRRYPGWPRHLEAPLAGPPVLLTVGGRDVVVAALRNGYVYAFDQAGGRYPGFPVSAGAHLDGPLLATAGPTLARSVLRLVNQHGELVTLTLSGDITARRRVATWSRTATFRLVPEAGGRAGSFVVVRQDGGQLDVFSPGSVAPLLSRQFVTSGEKPVQWFDFGVTHQVLALTEPLPGQVWLFDGQGRPLGAGGPTPALAAWPSTGTGVGLRYDAARQRYQLLRLVRRELRRDEVRTE